MSTDYFIYTPLIAFTLARSSDVDARFQQVETGLALLPSKLALQQDRTTFAVATGTANALVITLPQPVTVANGGYMTGLRVRAKIIASNTGATTINVDGLGVRNIIRADGTVLQAGDLLAGQMATFDFDGTDFRLSMGFNETSAAGLVAAIAGQALAQSTVTVTDEVYGAGWNASLQVPTKNAVYDKIETLPPINSPAFTGTPTAPTAAVNTNTQQIATTAFVTAAIPSLAAYAPLASPALTGTPTAPTAVGGTSTTQIATTAFVAAAIGGSSDPETAAIAGLVSAADTLPYFTGSGTAALAAFTTFGRSLVDDANAAAGRTTLGLGTAATSASGDFQAADAELAAIAGLVSAADRLPYFTGSGTAALATFSAFGRTLVDDADAAAARATLGINDIANGTYTPTVTLTTNVAAASADTSQYLRIGNSVTVSGRVSIDPTATGLITLGLSLPIGSNVLSTNQIAGVCIAESIDQSFAVYGDAANDRATINGIASDTANRFHYFHFTYLVN